MKPVKKLFYYIFLRGEKKNHKKKNAAKNKIDPNSKKLLL
jgi:hypothetical protein